MRVFAAAAGCVRLCVPWGLSRSGGTRCPRQTRASVALAGCPIRDDLAAAGQCQHRWGTTQCPGDFLFFWYDLGVNLDAVHHCTEIAYIIQEIPRASSDFGC
jgi:hypothetical protein